MAVLEIKRVARNRKRMLVLFNFLMYSNQQYTYIFHEDLAIVYSFCLNVLLDSFEIAILISNTIH